MLARRTLLLAAAAVAAACARYTPAPLDPAASAATLESRRLDDPGLARYLAEQGAEVPATEWSERDLVLAAYYFHPALAVARSSRSAADAAIGAAGIRTRPDLEAEAGYGVTGSDALESPWVAALAAVFTLELGGKRGARISAARARAAAAAIEADAVALRVGRGVIAAARELTAAAERVAEARAEREAAEALAAAASARYKRGEAGRLDAAAVEAAALESRAREAAEAARLGVGRTALAEAIGVPRAAVDSLRLHPASSLACTPGVAEDSLRRAALVRRLEVGQALAAYAVREAELRVAVAGSHPDLALGPGFTWDQGVGRWSVLLGLPSLPLDGNRGAIGQAVAHRALAATHVPAVQQQVLAEVEAALARCSAARAESAVADSISTAAERRVEAMRQAYARGEAAASDTAAARVPLARARSLAGNARRREAEAALALATAVGGPSLPQAADPPSGTEALR
jgi:outer membrane protein TolC